MMVMAELPPHVDGEIHHTVLCKPACNDESVVKRNSHGDGQAGV